MQRRFPTIAIALTALAVLTVAPAVAGPPVGKIYDCYTNSSIGLSYVQAIQLKTASVYLVAPFRKGSKLSGKAAKGRYRAHGNKITWLTGPYAKRYVGVFHPATAKGRANIELDEANGHWTGVSCDQH